MRRRILPPVPLAQAPAPSTGPLAIAGFRGWRMKEPGSQRRYTVVKLTSQSGLSGYGEGGETKASDFADARKVLLGRRATAAEFVRSHFASTPAVEAAINNAMLDLA